MILAPRSKTKYRIVMAFIISGVLVSLGYLYSHRLELQRKCFETILTRSLSEFFTGPIRLKGGYIDRSLKMHLRDLEGTLVTEGGPIPIHITRIESLSSLTRLFSSHGCFFSFDGLRPALSAEKGIRGRTELKLGPKGFYKFKADIDSLNLSDVQWLNPENLSGSEGAVTGWLQADGDFKSPVPHFAAVITAQNGGTVQSRFFDVILPYLPEMPTKKKIKKLVKKESVVPFKNAALRMELTSANKMKVFLHILVPDFHVELNINLEIRVDETSSLNELAQVMGFIKVQV